MEAALPSSSGLTKFDPSDTSTVSNRWKKWKRCFEIFLDVNNVTIAARKRSYLLHYAGCDVQDIFFNLRGDEEVPVPEGSDLYKESVKLLDNYFLPLKCLPRERHIFRNLEQNPDESIEKFVLRLREQGSLCEYGDWMEENIKEQIFEKGISDDLRAKILTQPDMTLAQTVELARSLETIEKHRNGHKVELLNRISRTRGECFRCGHSGHYASDDECPARDKKCERCHLLGHFKRCCKTKAARGHKDSRSRRKHKVRQITDEDTDGEKDDSSGDDDSSADEEKGINYVFALSPDTDEKVTCEVGGVELKWVVDSGTGVNVVSRSAWEYLKIQKVTVQFQTAQPKNRLMTYGNHQLRVLGMFVADITTNRSSVSSKIFVVKEHGFNLLGRTTATDLGLLKIDTTACVAHPGFNKVGKLKENTVVVRKDPALTSVTQKQYQISVNSSSVAGSCDSGDMIAPGNHPFFGSFSRLVSDLESSWMQEGSKSCWIAEGHEVRHEESKSTLVRECYGPQEQVVSIFERIRFQECAAYDQENKEQWRSGDVSEELGEGDISANGLSEKQVTGD